MPGSEGQRRSIRSFEHDLMPMQPRDFDPGNRR
jgi:hypothetical protein